MISKTLLAQSRKMKIGISHVLHGMKIGTDPYSVVWLAKDT